MKFTKSVFAVGLLMSQACLWAADTTTISLRESIGLDPTMSSLDFRNKNNICSVDAYGKSYNILSKVRVGANDTAPILTGEELQDVQKYPSLSVAAQVVPMTNMAIASWFYDVSPAQTDVPQGLRRTDFSEGKVVAQFAPDGKSIAFSVKQHSETDKRRVMMANVMNVAKDRGFQLSEIYHRVALGRNLATDSIIGEAREMTEEEIIGERGSVRVYNNTGVYKTIEYMDGNGFMHSVTVAPFSSQCLVRRDNFGRELLVESQSYFNNSVSGWIKDNLYQPKTPIDCTSEQHVDAGRDFGVSFGVSGVSTEAQDMSDDDKKLALFDAITLDGNPDKVAELDYIYQQLQQ